MGALMKQTMATLNGRGGGSKDMAQGGVPTAEGLESAPRRSFQGAKRVSPIPLSFRASGGTCCSTAVVG